MHLPHDCLVRDRLVQGQRSHSGVSPTVSTSGFGMSDAGTYSEKIWDGDARYGAFRVATPASVSCVVV
jgi:hypothetical protein